MFLSTFYGVDGGVDAEPDLGGDFQLFKMLYGRVIGTPNTEASITLNDTNTGFLVLEQSDEIGWPDPNDGSLSGVVNARVTAHLKAQFNGMTVRARLARFYGNGLNVQMGPASDWTPINSLDGTDFIADLTYDPADEDPVPAVSTSDRFGVIFEATFDGNADTEGGHIPENYHASSTIGVYIGGNPLADPPALGSALQVDRQFFGA